MTRRRKRMNPLLYIDQREYQEVANSMQDKFFFNDRDQSEETDSQQKEETVRENPENAVDTLETSTVEGAETVEKKEKKSFKEMSIEEKIGYLEQFPASIVKILYAFTTNENKTVAYFLSANEDTIKVIPLGKRKPVVIAVKDIIDINVHGL